ncbi:outer membrane beta-barrel protein [Puia dinghuensis]|uniref:Outer membrane protein beta-barrel domain-containing protein n=1 Tax=Puia dinghuensis TaxID=1792502 RepID=A0A8J2XRB3_9BACT|nr:outer membrane beta-barrel protein [Puia dinghuensis]GGA99970.1 hypothetical protein GCM10011511_24110 [Puia dinghuensis]
MSNLKDTDFDDLFRRASEKYPLRTDSSDWDRMSAALEKDAPPKLYADAVETDKRKRRKFLWFFLLLPLGGAGYYTWHQMGHGAGSGQAVNTVVVSTPAATSTPATATTPAGPARTDRTTPEADHTATGANHATPEADRTAAGTNRTTTLRNLNTTEANRSTAGTNHTAANRKTAGANITRTKHNRDRFAADHTSYPDADKVADRGIASNHPASTSNHPANSNPVASAFTLRSAGIDGQLAPTTGPWNLSVDVKAPPKDSSVAKKQASPKKRSSFLYAGVLAAPDFSVVKFQSMKGVGSTFGVLVGYAFNDRWAVETGVYVDRKRYYTEGEYFSTKKLNIPPYVDLLNLDGTCYMWEIPLNVRYTFNPAGKTRWFATAGFSTYLMTREKYNYAAENYTTSRTWDGSYDWKKSSQYPFSVVNLSAGFEQRLGKVGNLRVEPYVRLPLGGIGTGSLPIMSTGVNVGITRRLWGNKK